MSALPMITTATTLLVGASSCLSVPLLLAKDLPSPTASVATVFPTSTSGVLLVNTCPNAWVAFNQLNPFSQVWSGFKPQRLLPNGVDFNRDIQPWLGNYLILALLSSNPKTGKGLSPVVVLPVTQADQVERLLKQLKANRGAPHIERSDPDRTLLYWEPTQSEPATEKEPDTNSEQPKALSDFSGKANQVLPKTLSVPEPTQVLRRQGLAIAQFSGYLAISNQLAPLEQLQTTNTGQPSLATSPQFKRSLQQFELGRSSCESPQSGSLIMGYGNLKQLTNSLTEIAEGLQGEASLSFLNLQQLGQIADLYDTVDLSIWTEPDSIRIQTNVYYTRPRPENAVAQTPDHSESLLSRLPAITYLSANSRNLNNQWQEIAGAAKRNSTTKLLVDILSQGFQSITGLSLDRDVIPWVDGNYAFFLFPTKGGLFNQLHPRLNMGLGVMVQTRDRPAAENALKKMNRFIQSNAQQDLIQVDRQQAGQPVISWESKGRNTSILAYSWLTPDTLIVTTGLEPLSILMPKPYLTLDQNPTFLTAKANLPQPNQGYFYINMGASLSLIYGLLFPNPAARNDPFLREVQQMLGRIRSIVSTQSKTSDREQLDTRFVIAPQMVKPQQPE